MQEQLIVEKVEENRKFPKRTVVSAALILVFIPLTIFLGFYFLDDRKYYFISFFIGIYALIPFLMVFEDRRPQARELLILTVLTAIAVAGRAAFFMLPQFKPVAAIVIIAGVCFGPEAGFLVGAMSGFVSNFFFGQGPWTPWQMFSFGIIGFLAGLFFHKGFLKKQKLPLCIFGGVTTLLIYGGIMNLWTLLSFTATITVSSAVFVYSMGLPMDLVHASATVIFLYFIAKPMMEKLDRIKIKYGLVEP